ncbi:MAG: glycine cleavage system aminomethyltransferase GcvT [Planctomycetia bacterium]|nr:glycine cleavage system aminomethyltransferase GcvT [Planctomycetia bacterium]
MSELKRTPLYEKHIKYNGRIIDFGGWELPVQYEGILKEHEQVRSSAGLFDVSHMGEILVQGKGAFDFVQNLITNDLNRIGDKQVIYSPICYPDGGCVDDLIVYRYSQDHFFIVVNAANTDKDFAWFKEHAPKDLLVENLSSQYAQLAVQGPKAQEILQTLTDFDLNGIAFFHFEPEVLIAGKKCIVSRTGYTGEDGFELYADPKDAGDLWESLLNAGGSSIAPIGLGARDTLRFEAKLPLYGHEISAEISPVEAGLGFFVRPEIDADFLGKDVLKRQKENGADRDLCEFIMIDRGIPRAGYEVFAEGEKIGFITTGMFAPTLQKNIGLALIQKKYAKSGQPIEISIRNKLIKAEVGKGLFYSKKTKRN